MSDLREELQRRVWRELNEAPGKPGKTRYVYVGNYLLVAYKYSMAVRCIVNMQAPSGDYKSYVDVFTQGSTNNGKVVRESLAQEVVMILREKQVLEDLADV